MHTPHPTEDSTVLSAPSEGATLTMVPRGVVITPPTTPALVLPPRYRDLGRIATGGCGDVRRVQDTQFDRVLAIKVLRWEYAGSVEMRARFLVEAEVTAQLEHPGIVAVHERGELADGRPWFTMKEIRGRTLWAVLTEVHAAATIEGFRPASSGWTFRRLVDAFARIAQAVAFAHRRGVVHRDLKPDNLMVGEYGEVLVMDWGLARRIGAPAESVRPAESAALAALATPESSEVDDGRLTRVGEVLGTPAYMAPEQARGQHERHGPESDVYALGAILYHLLAGRAPYLGGGVSALRQVLAGPPPDVRHVIKNGPPLPEELVAICARAMLRSIEGRYTDAGAMADEVVAWLDGAHRREQALGIVARAREREAAILTLRAEKAALEDEAARRLATVRPFDPVEVKASAWDCEDEAARCGRELALKETEWLEGIHGALSVDPELAEAHAALADHYRDKLLEAEIASRGDDAVRFESLLRSHARGRHEALLRGEGALTLITDPPGASVQLFRYVSERRRLVLAPVGEPLTTPIVARALPQGSYLCVLRAEGRAEVRYPVQLLRGAHWDGVAPGEKEPFPILLPRAEEIDPDEIYVPAGPGFIGGDPGASDSLPSRRVWIDGFVLGRHPITNREYLAFLNALVDAGREDDALLACPRDPPSLSGVSDGRTGRLIYGRDADGRFTLAGEEFGRRWEEDWPVALIDWHGASAYARWRAEVTGRAYRLPSELEREKAARGVDGRFFPWGNQADPTFARVAESDRLPMRVSVGQCPLDESPYGARGLGGNMRDHCLEVWLHDGPPIEGGRLVLTPARADDPEFRSNRGGSWTSPLERARAAGRFGNLPNDRRESIGVRVARSFPVRRAPFTGLPPGPAPSPARTRA